MVSAMNPFASTMGHCILIVLQTVFRIIGEYQVSLVSSFSRLLKDSANMGVQLLGNDFNHRNANIPEHLLLLL